MTMAAPSTERRLASRAIDLPAEIVPPGTRATILSSALRLFAESGFAGASIRDIAKVAGVRSATLYGHFESKEQILAALIESAHREHYRRLSTALLESGADPVDQLSAVVRAHVLMHAEYPMLTVVANSELHALSAELGAGARSFRRRSEELIADVVRRGTELGAFDPVHPWMALAAIGAMGIRVANWFTAEFELDAAAVADVYAEFARRIVGVPGGEAGARP
jgi:AcrR family transcriptional regulator